VRFLSSELSLAAKQHGGYSYSLKAEFNKPKGDEGARQRNGKTQTINSQDQ
jgi:hypothetical protein